MSGQKRDAQLAVGLRKAIEWISLERQAEPKRRLGPLIDEAGRKFDLSPADAEFLYRHFSQQTPPLPADPEKR